jgi:hypothetical protein
MKSGSHQHPGEEVGYILRRAGGHAGPGGTTIARRRL